MTDKNYIEKNLCTEGLDASKTKLYCSNDLEWKKLLSRNYFNKSKLNDSFLFAMICEAAINNQVWNCEGKI